MKAIIQNLKNGLGRIHEGINLEALVRQIEIMFVAGVLLYVYQRTGNFFAGLFFVSILVLDVTHIVANALSDASSEDDTSFPYGQFGFTVLASVLAIYATVSIVRDFAAIQ